MSPERTADPQRERRVVRRGLVAGGIVWALFAVPIALVALTGDAGGRGIVGAALIGLVFGSVTAAGWLLLAAGLDLVADVRPTRRRARWTAGMTLFALLSPMLVIAAR